MDNTKHNRRCPACGKYIPAEADGYYAAAPGERLENGALSVVYCNSACANSVSRDDA